MRTRCFPDVSIDDSIAMLCIQALVIGFEEAFPLWALSTPGVGGLGWGTVEIGEVKRTPQREDTLMEKAASYAEP